MNRWQL